MKSRSRLELALERLKGSQWERFEEFASEFMAGQFAEIRSVASPSGDRGRDAQLFSPKASPTVMLQYSVDKKWSSKIRDTAERISGEFPEARILIYVTNQDIGAMADKLKRELRKDFGLHLDVRDRPWFLDRRLESRQQEAAAESLAQDIVDPYLASDEPYQGKSSGLVGKELRAALVYLSLQRRDDTEERNLTKLSFEALVRAVLRGTGNDSRMSRNEVQERVKAILPEHPEDKVHMYVDSALARMDKDEVRHWKKEDEFCLSHSERKHVSEQLEEHEADEAALNRELREVIEEEVTEDTSEPVFEEFADRLRNLLERFFFHRGELFASAVHSGQYHHLGFDEARDLIIQVLSEDPIDAPEYTDSVDVLARSLRKVLTSPSKPVQKRLRSLSDSYSLLAFLQLVPDVQSATRKMFSHGTLWLDTTVLLPVFAEELLEEESEGRFSRLLRAANDVGMTLQATNGVLEEIASHMDKCISCSRMPSSEWVGPVPYLFSEYISQGRRQDEFAGWIRLFKGAKQPLDDIADYLDEKLDIGVKDLEEQVDDSPDELKRSVEAIWSEAHQSRRAEHSATSSGVVDRLVSHDVENYLGVIQRRKEAGRRTTGFGYRYWWLTLDKTAFRVQSELRDWLDYEPPNTPVMSADFLSNYLVFGPTRARSTASFDDIPVALDVGLIEIDSKLVDYAGEVREKMDQFPERVIRREVRDELNEARRRLGTVAWGGLQTLDEDSAPNGAG